MALKHFTKMALERRGGERLFGSATVLSYIWHPSAFIQSPGW